MQNFQHKTEKNGQKIHKILLNYPHKIGIAKIISLIQLIKEESRLFNFTIPKKYYLKLIFCTKYSFV